MIVSLAPVSTAQVNDSTANVRRGVVAIEAAYGQTPGISIALFTSRTKSWLLGVDRVTYEYVLRGETLRSSSTGLRIGARQWAPTRGPLELFIGAGISAADLAPEHTSAVGDGYGYGELGTAWFVAPHLSLVAAGELTVVYGKARSAPAIDAADGQRNQLLVHSTRVRLGGAVYLF